MKNELLFFWQRGSLSNGITFFSLFINFFRVCFAFHVALRNERHRPGGRKWKTLRIAKGGMGIFSRGSHSIVTAVTTGCEPRETMERETKTSASGNY